MATRRSTPTPAARAATSAAGDYSYPVPTPVPAPAPVTPGDISAALLDLLRKVNAETPTRPPLEGRALAAVANYRRIATDLRTLADPAPTASGTGGLATSPRT